MELVTFEWDFRKNRSNQRKHGIAFEEAQTAFYDDNARLLADPEHSGTEDRFVLMGLSQKANLLVVCHCYRCNDEIIRIISARKATKKENLFYYREA